MPIFMLDGHLLLHQEAIASVGLEAAAGLTLVTTNTAEFQRVNGLAIENWTLPRKK